MDAQIPIDDEIPMEDGDSHGGRRYPEDEDGPDDEMPSRGLGTSEKSDTIVISLGGR